MILHFNPLTFLFTLWIFISVIALNEGEEEIDMPLDYIYTQTSNWQQRKIQIGRRSNEFKVRTYIFISVSKSMSLFVECKFFLEMHFKKFHF